MEAREVERWWVGWKGAVGEWRRMKAVRKKRRERESEQREENHIEEHEGKEKGMTRCGKEKEKG